MIDFEGPLEEAAESFYLVIEAYKVTGKVTETGMTFLKNTINLITLAYDYNDLDLPLVTKNIKKVCSGTFSDEDIVAIERRYMVMLLQLEGLLAAVNIKNNAKAISKTVNDRGD